MKNDDIDYFKIARAQAYYRALGYRNIDTPWLVSNQAVSTTLPADCRPFDTHNFGTLVGSGEQGFIELMLQGVLEPGRYQTATPCFRDEKNITDTTRQSFFKVELIWYMPEDTRAAYELVFNNAISCFFDITDIENFEALQTGEGYDIMYKGIELGSYGVRQVENHLWVFGTGIAEPRFSQAIRQEVPAEEPND